MDAGYREWQQHKKVQDTEQNGDKCENQIH